MGQVWKRRVTAVAIGTAMGTFATYVLANLLLVNLAPVLHQLTLTIEVLDGATSFPIQGATVEWAAIPPHTAARDLGSTGSDGRFQFSEAIQENPWWVWPMVGSFQFTNRVLRVHAPLYGTEEVHLSQALSDLPYSNPSGRLRVPLSRK